MGGGHVSGPRPEEAHSPAGKIRCFQSVVSPGLEDTEQPRLLRSPGEASEKRS